MILLNGRAVYGRKPVSRWILALPSCCAWLLASMRPIPNNRDSQADKFRAALTPNAARPGADKLG
jgi:hypothetical protein